MPNIYAQNSKISNVVGRSLYISGKSGKQEEVIVSEQHLKMSWKEHSQFEIDHRQQSNQSQNEAREMIIALPNELAEKEKMETSQKQKEKLSTICNDIAKEVIGKNFDYEFAVHWNHDRTNLHCHILYSERENVLEATEKRYKRDIWMDEETHKLAKKNAPGAILVHRKGEVMVDEEGNIKYSSAPLKPKDPKFKSHTFMEKRNKAIQDVLKTYGYDLFIQDKESPYLSQKKLYKGASMDYIENSRAYNSAVKDYNRNVKQAIQLEPEQRPVYCEIRHDIEDEVKMHNSQFKKISKQAIQAIRDMSDYIVKQIQDKIHTMGEFWNTNKEKIIEFFNDKHALQDQAELQKELLKQADTTIDTLQEELNKAIEKEKNTFEVKEVNIVHEDNDWSFHL